MRRDCLKPFPRSNISNSLSLKFLFSMPRTRNLWNWVVSVALWGKAQAHSALEGVNGINCIMHLVKNSKNISSELQGMCCEWTIAFLQRPVGKQGRCVLQMHNCSSSISSALSFITGFLKQRRVSGVPSWLAFALVKWSPFYRKQKLKVN